MKKLVKNEMGNELNSYYDMMRCSCGLCGCVACVCTGSTTVAASVSKQIATPHADITIEAGFRSAPSA